MKNKFYWKDVEEFKGGSWAGIALEVDNQDFKPGLQLHTGENFRIRLDNNGFPVFWATIADCYYGVWYLKSNQCFEPEMMPVRPIRSSDVEKIKAMPDHEKYRAWTRFFVEELKESQASFLYSGRWFFCGYRKDKVKWDYSNLLERDKFDCNQAFELKNALNLDNPLWIDWFMGSFSEVIPLHNFPSEDDGRVKWWRKKVRENSLPPILLWHITCLDAYVIVDGHARLVASILEDKAPQIIVAYSAREEAVVNIGSKQEKVVDSLFKERDKRHSKFIPVDRLNEVLVRAFDNRPYNASRTVSTAIRNFNDIWEAEVKEELLKLGNPIEGEMMIERESD